MINLISAGPQNIVTCVFWHSLAYNCSYRSSHWSTRSHPSRPAFKTFPACPLTSIMQTHPSFNRTLATGIILSGVSMLAFVAGLQIMKYGVGASPDSVCYIDTARNILARLSFSCHFRESGAFPPGYPLLLAINSSFGSDVLDTARWLNAYIYALNSVLVGILVYLSSKKSAPFAIIAQLLFLSSSSLLTLHTMAWSEPPFILFLLLTVLFFILYIRKPNLFLLLFTSFSASLVLLTRYIGISVIPPIILAMLLLKYKPLKERLKDSLIFMTIASFPLGLWTIVNHFSSNNIGDRVKVFHPIDFSQIKSIISVLTNYFIPKIFLNDSYTWIVFGLTSGLILWVIILSISGYVKAKQRNSGEVATLVLFISFILIYMLVLVISISFFDASTPLDSRILSPIYVADIILILTIIQQWCNSSGKPTIRWLFILLSAVIIYINATQFWVTASQIRQSGQSYSSLQWKASKSIQFVNSLPKDSSIYSNNPEVIYFLTGRYTNSLPYKEDPTTTLSNPNFQIEMINLTNDLNHKDTYVIVFQKTERAFLPSKKELTNAYHLPKLLDLKDGEVFGISH